VKAKTIEASLRRSEASFRTLFDANPSASILLVDRKFEKANLCLCKLVGYSEGELIGRSSRLLYPSDEEYERAGRELYAFTELDELGSATTRFLRKDGRVLDVVIYARRLYPEDSDGREVIAATVFDVTERKLLEERYRSVIEATMEGFAVHDREGRILEVNDAYCRISGFGRDELLGKNVAELSENTNPTALQARLSRIAGCGSERMETRHRRKDGKIIDLEANVSYLPRCGCFFVFLREVTEQKRLHALVQNSLHQKDAFILDLNHRMKDGMTLIRNIVNMEIERTGNQTTADVLKDLRGRIDSIVSLYGLVFRNESVSDLRLDSYISSIVANVVESYSVNTAVIGMQLRLDEVYTDAAAATIWGFIANELVTNSVKHAFPGAMKGTIRVELVKSIEGLSLSVSDDGAGPPPDFDFEHPRGLGLVLVRSLAERLHGVFRFLGREGCFFTVQAPSR